VTIHNSTYVLATANPGKIKEMREILSKLDIEVVSREDLGIDAEIEETGTSFEENSQIKAVAICKIAGIPAIADDSGLVVDALGGEPGVYSSSYGGEALTADERCDYLLKKMDNTEQRKAKFVCTIVCAFPNGDILTTIGECCGVITTEPVGTGGFGYDPVFLPDNFKKTMAELTTDEKNKISHRGVALRKLSDLLISYRAGKVE
jgi:XTP/dITP diphosphohydrolase